jgi:uncharacterized protein YecE (DUF72 family)
MKKGATTPKRAKKARAFVGTSGFIYDHWGNGVFYPEGTPQRRWLEYYAGYFDTVELNVAFYRLPSEETFQSWYKRTPKGFTFALKGSRFITHIKRLKNCQGPLDLYFQRAKLLKEKLSVVLWQLPPRFKKDTQRLKDFTRMLKRHYHTRHSFEFRDESWLSEDVFELLREADIALCMADWPIFSQEIPQTAGFLYLRRHGPEAGEGMLYSGCYPPGALRRDARDIKGWLSQGKDVYIYFNNDEGGWAVKNALDLTKLIRLSQTG